MNFRYIVVLTLLLTFGGAGAVCASEPTPEGELICTMQRVDSLDRKIESINKRNSFLPHVSGYLQLGYTYNGDLSTFEAKRARLIIKGDIHPKISYLAQVAFENLTPMLCDAQIAFKPFNQLKFTIGEMRLPFAIENQYGPTVEECITYSMALDRLVATSDVCSLRSGGRDIGLMVHGGFFNRGCYDIINYNVGIYNGNGINLKDNNKTKDFSGRLSIMPIKGLTISDSYYWGQYGVDRIKRIRYAGGVEYKGDLIFGRSEYIGGVTGNFEVVEADRDDHKKGDIHSLGGGSFRSDGCYALLGCWIAKKVAPIVRYEFFRGDVAKRETMQENFLVGLDYRPIKYLRCQLNYTYEMYHTSAKRDRNVVSVLLTGMF